MRDNIVELDIFIEDAPQIQEIECSCSGVENLIELDVVSNLIDIPLDFEYSSPVDLDIELDDNEIDIEVEIVCQIAGGGGEHPIYPGPYAVIPKSRDQSLPTRDKLMVRDVLVEEVPTYETSNQKGYTFIIL